MRTEGDFEAVRKDIVNLLRQPEYDDGSAGPVFVRLAWYVLPSHEQHRRLLRFLTSIQLRRLAIELHLLTSLEALFRDI